MSYLPRYIPRFCARGYVEQQGDGVNFVQCSLFNPSTGPYLLVIRDFIPDIETDTQVYTSYANGPQGTKTGSGVNIVPGEPTPPGDLYSRLVASAPARDYEVQQDNVAYVPWPHDYPFAVLLPQWSLCFTSNGASSKFLKLSLFWQYCRADDLDGSLADLELKLAGG